MKRKALTYILCLCFVVTGLTGCGGSSVSTEDELTVDVDQIVYDANSDLTSDGKTIISIYAQYADDDTIVPYEYAIEQLATAYPNVELNLIIQSQDDGATLRLLDSAGQLPDIYQCNTSLISSFIDEGNVMQLDSAAPTSVYLSKLYDSCQDLAYYSDGHIYCYPYAGNEYVLWYYNKALFESCGLEVPKTYDDLLNCIEVFRNNGITPVATWQEGWITSAIYDVFATRYVSSGIYGLDTGETSISDAAFLQAAEDVETFVDAGMFNDNVENTDYDTASKMFLEGKAAMFLSGQWFIPDATAALGDNVDWMFYPAKDEATYENTRYAFSGGGSTSGYAVNPKGRHVELATEIAEFMAEKYCEAKVMYRDNPLVALDTGAVSEDELSPMMEKLSETIPAMTSTTKFTWGLSNSTFYDSLVANSLKLVSGDSNAAQFISGIQQ